MSITEWLNNHATQVAWDGGFVYESMIWVTNERRDYLTHVGMEDKLRFIADMNLSQVQSTWERGKPVNIGFSAAEQKWYGWSHRAIYGFGVGSKVSKGDCAYVGATPEDLIEDRVAFFSDLGAERAKLARDECKILPDRSGIRILHAPMILPVVSMENLAAILDGDDMPTQQVDICKDSWHIQRCGRGEWEAKSLEDAKQMAIDFAEGVA